jgi:hypothetical protein
MTISSETVGKFHQKQFLRPNMLFEFEFDFSSNQSGIKVYEMCSFVESPSNFLPGWELPAGYRRALGGLSFKLVFSNGA